MAMTNAKSIRNALKTFFKEHGREPNLLEFTNLVNGRPEKKKKYVEEKAEEPKN